MELEKNHYGEEWKRIKQNIAVDVDWFILPTFSRDEKFH